MRTLHRKLSLYVLGSLLVISVLGGALVIRDAREQLEEDLKHSGRTLASTIAAFCVESILETEYDYLETYIEQAVKNSPGVVYIRVWSETGDSGVVEAAGETAKEEPVPVLEYSLVTDDPDVKRRYAVFESPVIIDVEGYPPETLGRVELALSTLRHDHLVKSSTWQLVLGIGVTALLLGIVLAFALKKTVIEPVTELDEHASRIGSGDLDRPISLKSRDELGRLAQNMEAMRRGLKKSYAQIEDQLEELKELDRMKDEFLANTSHELRTPLNGILGLTEGLINGDYGEVPQSARQSLETVSSCAERLFEMTESILRYSQLVNHSRDREATVENHVIVDHLSECLVDVVATAERKGVRFLISVPHRLELRYPRTELEQVVRILADNAVKFTDEGLVQIIVRQWENGEVPGFQLAVRDSGSGIPEDMRRSVFEPFSQGFDHETRSHGGVGLGLAIVRHMIEELGWHLALDSEAGKGTSFTVLVPERKVPRPERFLLAWPPLEDPTSRDAPTPSTEDARLPEPVVNDEKPAKSSSSASSERRPHVLIADDDGVNREVLWMALKNHYRVTQASGGEECLRLLQAMHVDLLVLDIMMPRVSGYDVLQAMKERGLLDDVPVVVLSAKSTPSHIVKGLRLGASDYQGKPFHREEILCRIRNQLKLKDHKRRLEEEIEEKTQALRLAEEASQVKTQFLANMSHEILTPLNGIYGFLSLALAEKSTETTSQLRDNISSAHECAKSLLQLANDILDIARIESRQVNVDWKECDVARELGGVAQAFSARAVAKGLEFGLDLPEDLDPRIVTDPSRFRQIVTNLAHNAVKFTQVGRVVVSVRQERSRDSQQDGVRVDVSDTGHGIEASQLEKIFDPFHQVDSSSTREHGGAGLGLSLSLHYARMLGGDLTVTSRPGEGSTFSLFLPRVPRGEVRSTVAASSSPAEESSGRPSRQGHRTRPAPW